MSSTDLRQTSWQIIHSFTINLMFTYWNSAHTFKEPAVSSDVAVSQSFMLTKTWNCIWKSFVTQPSATIWFPHSFSSINLPSLSVSKCQFIDSLTQNLCSVEQPCILCPHTDSSEAIACKCERGRDSDTLMGFIKVNLNTLTVWAWTSKPSLHSTANYSGHPSNSQAGKKTKLAKVDDGNVCIVMTNALMTG